MSDFDDENCDFDDENAPQGAEGTQRAAMGHTPVAAWRDKGTYPTSFSATVL